MSFSHSPSEDSFFPEVFSVEKIDNKAGGAQNTLSGQAEVQDDHVMQELLLGVEPSLVHEEHEGVQEHTLQGEKQKTMFTDLQVHVRTIRSGIAMSMSAFALGGLLSCTPQGDPLLEPLLPPVSAVPTSPTPLPRIHPETKLPNRATLLPCRTDTGECAELEEDIKKVLGDAEVVAKDLFERVKTVFGEVKETFTQEVGITVDPDKKLSGVVFLEDVPTSLIFSPAPKVNVPSGTTYRWTLTRLNAWSFSTGTEISTIQAERAQFTFTERKKHKVVLTTTYPDGRVVSVSVHVLFVG